MNVHQRSEIVTCRNGPLNTLADAGDLGDSLGEVQLWMDEWLVNCVGAFNLLSVVLALWRINADFMSLAAKEQEKISKPHYTQVHVYTIIQLQTVTDNHGQLQTVADSFTVTCIYKYVKYSHSVVTIYYVTRVIDYVNFIQYKLQMAIRQHATQYREYRVACRESAQRTIWDCLAPWRTTCAAWDETWNR